MVIAKTLKFFKTLIYVCFIFCHGQRISLQLEVVQKVSAYAITRTKIIGKCLKAKKCVGVKCQIQISLAGDGLSLSKCKNWSVIVLTVINDRWVSKIIRKKHNSTVTSVAWHPNNVSKMLFRIFPLSCPLRAFCFFHCSNLRFWLEKYMHIYRGDYGKLVNLLNFRGGDCNFKADLCNL